MPRLMLLPVVLGALLSGFTPTRGQDMEPPDLPPLERHDEAVVQDYLVFFDCQPGCFFHQSRADYIDGYAYASHDQLRKAAAQLKLESHRLRWGDEKRRLRQSYLELEELAEYVMLGRLESLETLDHAFARAHAALAFRYDRLAREAWEKEQELSTGRYLDVLIMNIEGGRAWSGRPFDAAGVRALDEAAIIAGQLIAGKGWDEGGVRRALAQLHEQQRVLDDIILAAGWGDAPVEVGTPGMPLVVREVWLAFEEEPNHLFHLIRRQIIDRAYGAAARDLERAMAFVRIKRSGADGDAAKMLDHALSELREILDELHGQRTAELEEVNHAFACTHLALSMYWHAQASATSPQRDPNHAADYLESVAAHLNRASLWSSGGLDSIALNAAWRANHLVKRMRDRTAWDAVEYDETLRDLREGIVEAKSRIEPED